MLIGITLHHSRSPTIAHWHDFSSSYVFHCQPLLLTCGSPCCLSSPNSVYLGCSVTSYVPHHMLITEVVLHHHMFLTVAQGIICMILSTILFFNCVALCHTRHFTVTHWSSLVSSQVSNCLSLWWLCFISGFLLLLTGEVLHYSRCPTGSSSCDFVVPSVSRLHTSLPC